MRIGCLQFAPRVGDIDNNFSRADSLLNNADPQNLDLLVLPELAFTGYNFKSLQDIKPFLEHQGSGISANWARRVARKLNCIVTVGYPEKVDEGAESSDSPEYYNSVIAVNNTGETIAHYRKTFLFYTDETWALEGPEGFYGGLIPGLGITSMGICMDLNPYKFEAPWRAFEFAFHCLGVGANLVIITMAWNTREDAHSFGLIPNEPDMASLKYWIARLEPVILSDGQEEIIVIFCNRCGIESDAIYVGTSTVIGVKRGEINVYGILGRGEEDLLVVDTKNPPCAKLVCLPDDQSSEATPDSDGETNKEDSHKVTKANPSPNRSPSHSISNKTIDSNDSPYQSKHRQYRSKKSHDVYDWGPGRMAASVSSSTYNHNYVPPGLNGARSTRRVIHLPGPASSRGLSISTSSRTSDRLAPAIAVRGQSPARADSPTLSANLFTALQA